MKFSLLFSFCNSSFSSFNIKKSVHQRFEIPEQMLHLKNKRKKHYERLWEGCTVWLPLQLSQCCFFPVYPLRPCSGCKFDTSIRLSLQPVFHLNTQEFLSQSSPSNIWSQLPLLPPGCPDLLLLKCQSFQRLFDAVVLEWKANAFLCAEKWVPVKTKLYKLAHFNQHSFFFLSK